MATVNRRPSISSTSSSSSTGKKPLILETSNKTGVKPQSAKNRPALTNITNRQNGSHVVSRVTGIQSKPMVPCSAKNAKKKEYSNHSRDEVLSKNTLPDSVRVKSRVLVHSKDALLPKNDLPSARVSVLPASICLDAVFPTPDTTFSQPRSMNVSPSRSLCGSVSLDETMSTCDSLKSPVFEYMDNEDVSVVQSIERKTNTSLYISKQAQKEGKICVKDIPVEMEPTYNVVAVDDISTDPQFCATIAFDIYKNLRASEAKKRPSMDFVEKVQKDVTASMRALLIDWLVEVAEEYRLVPQTLYLTVNYVDRYLSGNVMHRKQLQLLGVACMMIAAKYEEICAPLVEQFCDITDNTYSKEEVLQMESDVLSYLKFEMTAPTAKCFLRLFVCVAQKTEEVLSIKFECLANYITELSLVEYSMLCYVPSLIAASATFLAKFILSPLKKPWNSTLGHYILYQPSDLCDCVKALHHLCLNLGHSNLHAVREKYSQHKYKFVAKKYCHMTIPPEYFQDLRE